MASEVAPLARRFFLTVPGEKLVVHSRFNGTIDLDDVAHHSFTITSALKKKIDTDAVQWTTTKVAYALLSNVDHFWVDVDDILRFHGGCALVKTSVFGEDITKPSGYSENETDRAREKFMKSLRCEVSPGETGTPTLKRFDTNGTLWCRRRYTLEADDTYSFVQ